MRSKVNKSSSFATLESSPLPSLAIFLKSIFASLQPHDKTLSYKMSISEVSTLYNCVILSKAVYLAPKERDLPPEIGKIILESRGSDFYKIPFFITDSDILDTIFITCRGTYCFKDCLVDLKAEAVGFQNGLMHKGVYMTAKTLYNTIYPLISSIYKNNQNKNFIITGHSLGGGVAAAVNEMFHANIKDIHMKCICFAPCASFSHELLQKTKKWCKSYTMEGDFVPFCTFRNIVDLPQDSIPSTLRIYLKKIIKNRIQKQVYNPKLVPYDSNPFEEPPPPLTEILNDPVDMFFKPIQLYPPGECFILKLGKDNKGICVRKAKDDNYFTGFRNDLYELRHMMSFYREQVMQYCENYFKTLSL